MEFTYRKSLLRDITDFKSILDEDKDVTRKTFLTNVIDDEIHYLFTYDLIPSDFNQLYTIEYVLEIVGFVHFYGFDTTNSTIKLGYYLKKNYRGKSLLEPICRELINSIFETGRINKISVIIASNNKSSIRFIKKLNFRLDKRIFTFNIFKYLTSSDLRLFSLSK